MADAPPPPMPPPEPTNTYFNSPFLTISASCVTVGVLSLPLKPPIVTTGSPVAMMIDAVVCDPVAATRYFAEPWLASRYLMTSVLTEPPPMAPPPGGVPAVVADDDELGACAAPLGGVAPAGRAPDGIWPPRKPPPPKPPPAWPTLDGPASTLLPLSAWPTLATA